MIGESSWEVHGQGWNLVNNSERLPLIFGQHKWQICNFLQFMFRSNNLPKKALVKFGIAQGADVQFYMNLETICACSKLCLVFIPFSLRKWFILNFEWNSSKSVVIYEYKIIYSWIWTIKSMCIAFGCSKVGSRTIVTSVTCKNKPLNFSYDHINILLYILFCIYCGPNIFNELICLVHLI